MATGQSQALWGHTDFVSAIGYAIDPPGLISASHDGTIRCWSRTNAVRINQIGSFQL